MEELGVHLIVPFIEVSESRGDPISLPRTTPLTSHSWVQRCASSPRMGAMTQSSPFRARQILFNNNEPQQQQLTLIIKRDSLAHCQHGDMNLVFVAHARGSAHDSTRSVQPPSGKFFSKRSTPGACVLPRHQLASACCRHRAKLYLQFVCRSIAVRPANSVCRPSRCAAALGSLDVLTDSARAMLELVSKAIIVTTVQVRAGR